MLLPREIHPELSVYYSGALILQQLAHRKPVDLVDLYRTVKKDTGMSLTTYMLSLDWLYLSDIAIVTESGEVELCS